jgi:excisionase family DNA binding protein
VNLKTLSVTEAAQATGMPADAIRRLLDSGEIAGNRLGRKWRVSAASLDAWVNRTQAPASVTPSAFANQEDRFA